MQRGVGMRRIGAVILAAGGSTRMGTAKQLLMLDGKTLLRRAVESAIGAGCEPVVVVLGSGSDQMGRELNDMPIQAVINDQWERGIGTSIRAGFVALNGSAVDSAVLMLCDQALVSSESVTRLIEAADESDKAICVSAYDETIGPPVLVSRSFFSQMAQLPDACGAKALWKQNPQQVLEVPCPEAGLDVDSPEDYRKLCAGPDRR